MVVYIVIREGQLANVLSTEKNVIVKVLDFDYDRGDVDKWEEKTQNYKKLLDQDNINRCHIEEDG